MLFKIIVFQTSWLIISIVRITVAPMLFKIIDVPQVVSLAHYFYSQLKSYLKLLTFEQVDSTNLVYHIYLFFYCKTHFHELFIEYNADVFFLFIQIKLS